MKRSAILGLVLATAALVGCATARVVSVQPGEGGIVAVSPAQSAEARQKAQAIMERNCGSRRVKIVSEDEAVVGQQTYVSGSDYRRAGTFSAASQTQDQTEWRIRYKCE